MITRLLPPEEWPRLAGTELETVWPVLDPIASHVVVVEDAGEIVGCWALFRQVHVEGLWIAPAHRGKSSVGRRLLATMRSTARAMGARSVATAACRDSVVGMLHKLNAIALPGVHYALPVEKG